MNDSAPATFNTLEEVAQFKLSMAEVEMLLAEQEECTVSWTTKDGWPVGMTHVYVWAKASIWITISGQRKRVPALRERPKSCITVTSKGTARGPGWMVAIKCLATVHDDRDTLRWYLPLFMGRMGYPEEAFNNYFTPRRVVLEFKPQQFLSFAGDKLAEAIREADR